MLPDPLHPAVVHLPVALALLLPLLGLIAALSMRRGAKRSFAWAPVVATAAVLFAGAWLAVETGEDQEERVEGVIAESALEDHEELAEGVLVSAGVTFVLAALGLLPGRSGLLSRVSAGIAMLALAAFTVLAGHSGGELVYRHGAAAAYVSTSAPGSASVHGLGEDDD